jgi:hypothetical protein
MQQKEPVEGPNKANLQRLFKVGEYHLTIGLRKLDKKNWLTIDDNHHQLKADWVKK